MTKYKAVTPTGARLLVLKDPPETASEKGIELPTIAQTEKFTGVVVACGPDSAYSCGGRVMFASYVGIEIDGDIDGKAGPHVLLSDVDIVATVE